MEKEMQIRVLLTLLVKVAMALTKAIGGDDPILWRWAAGVEMEAREFAAVPTIPARK